jgi:ribonuclease P protein component
VWFVPEEGPPPPRLACAVSRKVGGAVVRNRLRRQMRAIFEDLARDPGVATGAYLVSLAPAAAEMSYKELKGHVASTLRGFEHQGERT